MPSGALVATGAPQFEQVLDDELESGMAVEFQPSPYGRALARY
ncbi:MAG: hypothetical protein ABI680_12030 [Chthoniobacteraceae bacterium]